MVDPELVAYIQKHTDEHGPKAVRDQLIADGMAPDVVDAHFKEAAKHTRTLVKKGGGGSGKRKAMLAVIGGGLMLLSGLMLSKQGEEAEATKKKKRAVPEVSSSDPIFDAAVGDDGGSVVQGHFGFMLRLPDGYTSTTRFDDPEKTVETMHIYRKGTDPSHFINEGMYEHLGILRLEVSPRRVPQGFIGIEQLEGYVKNKLTTQKAEFKIRSLIVHQMPAFIVSVQKPFRYTKAYVVGERSVYKLVGGAENELFNEVLKSMAEVSPGRREDR